MQKIIRSLFPHAESIQRLLHPYVEVVVHDIKKNKIAAIYNSFSKRKVGDASLLSQEEIHMVEDCIGPYEKINWDGRKLKSVSSIARDENGKAVAMLCLNLDVSKLEKIHHAIFEFINYKNLVKQPPPLFKDDWQERINKYVHAYLNKHHLTLEILKRSEKKALIEHLYEIGAFTGKNAAFYIAQIIGVSRATIYNYLASAEG